MASQVKERSIFKIYADWLATGQTRSATRFVNAPKPFAGKLSRAARNIEYEP